MLSGGGVMQQCHMWINRTWHSSALAHSHTILPRFFPPPPPPSIW